MPTPRSYAEPHQLRTYLSQLDPTAAVSGGLSGILERATQAVETVLGYAYMGTAESEKRVIGGGSPYLTLPPHTLGSVTEIDPEPTSGEWEEYGARLVLLNTDGTYLDWTRRGYLVTADWGCGSPPPDVVEVVLELAVQIYQGKDSGFSGIVGVDGGGAIGYEKALNPRQKLILQRRRAEMFPVAVF